MTTFVTALHVLVCFFLILVVLLQTGKGAEMGAVFGGGGSQTIFGASGAGNLLTKLTTGAAVVFFLTSLSLGWFANVKTSDSVFNEELPEPPPREAPAEAPPPRGAPGAGAGSGDAAEGAAPAPAADAGASSETTTNPAE